MVINPPPATSVAPAYSWPPSWTYAYGASPATGAIRSVPEDFIVTEEPVCEPSGQGEHVWLHVRKRNANTDWVARQLAQHAGVAAGAVSYAGLKDRNAVTEQWFSVHLPGRADPDWTGIDTDEVKILAAQRHDRKLRRGALRGNRFVIRVRELHGETAALETRLREIAAGGVPNYFGPQRFGHDGNNLAEAARWFGGGKRPRDRHKRSLILSAARSYVFNEALSSRVSDGSWKRGLVGDVLQLDGRSSWFPAPMLDDELTRRLQALELHATGPLWGRGRSPATDASLACEEQITAKLSSWCEGLEAAGLKQERRALRLHVRDLRWEFPEPGRLELAFALDAGSYATAVLRELIAESK